MDEPPYEINGNAIPVTGISPKFMPIFIKNDAERNEMVPIRNKYLNGDSFFSNNFLMSLKIRIEYKIITHIPPIKPNCSTSDANAKSV